MITFEFFPQFVKRCGWSWDAGSIQTGHVYNRLTCVSYLTCLRKSLLSRWHRYKMGQTALLDTLSFSGGHSWSCQVFFWGPDLRVHSRRPGQDTVMCQATSWYDIITGLSTSTGHRGFVVKVIRQCYGLVMKDLFLPWLLGSRLCFSQNVLPILGG